VELEVRRFEPRDGDAVLALASRLCVGVAPWRPAAGVARAAREWVRESIEAHDDAHPMWVAVLGDEVVGFLGASAGEHWSGAMDAYLGELVVADHHTRRGIGARLLEQVETWARARGLGRIRLETGAANVGARAFYDDAGYVLEEVTLSKALQPSRVGAESHGLHLAG
jgi:GNAT superfamily N-acetyltransferase